MATAIEAMQHDIEALIPVVEFIPTVSEKLAPLDDDLSLLLDRPFALDAFVGTHQGETTRLQQPPRQALLPKTRFSRQLRRI